MVEQPEPPESPRERLTLMFHLSAPAVELAAKALNLPTGSHGLDAGCGAGEHAGLLLEQVGPSGRLTGLDISEENVAWARKQCPHEQAVDFVRGDIHNLPFEDASFDWVWCADTLWPGALTDDPVGILAELKRVTKPGGTIALLYWSSQQLLAGYPELESRLESAFVETTPYLRRIPPELHFLRAGAWLGEAGLDDLQVGTFVAQIRPPIEPYTRQALAACYDMFWGGLTGHLAAADRQDYRRLCHPGSPEFVADAPGYYAFLTYTLFWGKVG